jgi:ketosteroid isomerase-like protein
VTTQDQIPIVQSFFQKCFYGDLSEAVAMLDPRVTYHVPGSHKAAGTFEGPESVAEHVSNLLKMTCGTVDVTQWEDWMVGVDNIAALVAMRVQKSAQIYNFRSVYVVAITDEDKIRHIDLFFGDEAAVDRFFM